MMQRRCSFREATARQRVAHLLDPGSFMEWLGPEQRLTSPHLAALGAPVAFDDGVVIGAGRLHGESVIVVAQEGVFNGGAVGEIHGAKVRGALMRAAREKPRAVLMLVDSGGVRLHEANAGLLAISEIMRALFLVQEAGVPVFALVGGTCGAFGGMGIVTRLCDVVVMSEEGRLGLSGPEVIETVKGVEEFDSRDRALVWRVTGGKIRRALGEAQQLVEDDVAAFREAVTTHTRFTDPQCHEAWSEEGLEREQARLSARRRDYEGVRDAQVIWNGLGVGRQVALMTSEEFNRFLQEAGLA